MNDRSSQPSLSLSISAVERDTGLSKDTLRVWERRYGFPQPARDNFGERIYPVDQVDKLRVMRRLMDMGHRPGKIINLDIEVLQQLASESASPPVTMNQARAEHEDLPRFIELVKAHKVQELRQALSQSAMRLGVDRFVMEVAAPLNRMVGDAWARGYFEIFEEHLYTESMQVVLRNSIINIPQFGKAPKVLLTTFPNEAHGLGLLMAEAILALAGARCISLGVQTPIWDIVLACTTQEVDIVALSFSASTNPNQVIEGLFDLRSKLPATTQIWAGGNCPILQRKPPKDVVVLPDLEDIHPALRSWRESQTPA
jgi:MerR family transcriptional regulator, light-induced transcriptional regulator